MFNTMLSKCGDVMQQWKMHLSQNQASTKKADVEYIMKCMQILFFSHFDGLNCECPVSCSDMYIDTLVETKYSQFARLSFQYLSNTVTEIKEKPAYPGSKFITDIGGWLSLFTGMSVLSLLEVFIFIVLSITALVRKGVLSRRKIR